MSNYFGTDGIRGKVGELVTPALAYRLGSALGAEGGTVVVGADTRISGNLLCRALALGITEGGAKFVNVGIVPTNAVSHFTRVLNGNYGIMISASHNPPEYNGFKVFDCCGAKLHSEDEVRISGVMDKIDVVALQQRGQEPLLRDYADDYAQDLLDAANVNCNGLSVALDCCYGSAHKIAPQLFTRAGASVRAYCNFNKGEQINVNCGATCPQFLGGLLTHNTPLAFAFDGDADRLTVYEDGRLLDNNAVFYCFAKYMKEEGLLTHNIAVGTVLTNMGLERSLGQIGIELRRSDVGDVKMYRLMNKLGARLAGEESGHYLFSTFACSSDAIFNALMVCKIYLQKGALRQYSSAMNLLPVTVKNIPLTLAKKEELAQKGVFEALNEGYTRLYPSCRVIIRPSGTENMARIFVEGEVALAEEIIVNATAKISAM